MDVGDARGWRYDQDFRPCRRDAQASSSPDTASLSQNEQSLSASAAYQVQDALTHQAFMREFQDIRSGAWRYTIVDNTNLKRLRPRWAFAFPTSGSHASRSQTDWYVCMLGSTPVNTALFLSLSAIRMMPNVGLVIIGTWYCNSHTIFSTR